LKNANLKFFELAPKYERDNIKLGLSRIKKALQELGNPCKNIPAIQIIGTNGNGSIAAYLESILFEAKRNFSVTTSPHLFDICERIRVNKKNIKEISEKARDGKLAIEDLQGGTFTISNGGVYGSMLSTPILNLPQSGVLGMHNIVERPIVVDGEIKIRPIMYLALSYDHRIIDGKESVSFLKMIKENLEDPRRLFLDI